MRRQQGGSAHLGSDRPLKEEWVVGIKEQCLRANVPFFFKQWGGVHNKNSGRELQGMVCEQMPRIQGQRKFTTIQA